MKPTLDPTTCYVLITEDHNARTRNRQIHVSLASEISDFMEEYQRNNTTVLIYFRRFGCTLDAKGHQLLLQSCGPVPKNCIISRMNPAYSNLIEKLTEDVNNFDATQEYIYDYNL